MTERQKIIKNSIRDIFDYIGENKNREGLLETPDRIIRSWDELFAGYRQNAKDILSKTFTDGACDEMVVLKDIEFYSFCEHHFLPFTGHVSIGYIPNGKVVGISKLARVVDVFSRRLQIQEKMTKEIANAIQQHLKPLGVMVVCKAVHMCMVCRGVKKQNSEMITSAICGNFSQPETRSEFLKLCENK